MKKYSEASYSDADYLIINIESICAIQSNQTEFKLFLRNGGQISVSKAIGEAIAKDFKDLQVSSSLCDSAISCADKKSPPPSMEAVQIPGREDPFFPLGSGRPPGAFEFASSHAMPQSTSFIRASPRYAPPEFLRPPGKGGFQ